MPPIMGAGAFVMAEFTKTPYGDIVWMALVPALLYFTSVLLYVHLMATKAGFVGASERPQVLPIFLNGLHFFLPLALITVLLLQNYSPLLVGAAGCAAVHPRTTLSCRSRSSDSRMRQSSSTTSTTRCTRATCRRTLTSCRI